MSPKAFLLDSNLLLLFVVGATSRALISRHKRLKAFIEKDYDKLVELLSDVPQVLLTPNTLTETSNLAGQIDEPARTEIYRMLRAVIDRTDEHYIRSPEAAGRSEFLRLGLTDAALLEASSEEIVILTTDVGLYLAALDKGSPARNFNHIRDQYL